MTPYTSPSWLGSGVSIVSMFERIERVITVPYYTTFHALHICPKDAIRAVMLFCCERSDHANVCLAWLCLCNHIAVIDICGQMGAFHVFGAFDITWQEIIISMQHLAVQVHVDHCIYLPNLQWQRTVTFFSIQYGDRVRKYAAYMEVIIRNLIKQLKHGNTDKWWTTGPSFVNATTLYDVWYSWMNTTDTKFDVYKWGSISRNWNWLIKCILGSL